MPGKYIVIEGHDGTGKSTQVEIIRTRLKERGIESIEFHEPQGTPIADAIRTIIKNGVLTRRELTNLLLFSAARHEIWQEFALPALHDGKWVVASRNYYSTLVYQGYAGGLAPELITDVTRMATDEQYLTPNVSLILAMDDEAERIRRIASRGESTGQDTFESKGGDFQAKVHKGYLELAAEYKLPLISASQAINQVTEQIWQLIEPELSSQA